MLTRGLQIQAKLVEEVEHNKWIVSFQGQLLQVENTSPLLFKESAVIELTVEKTDPLVLKVVSKSKNRRHLDRII